MRLPITKAVIITFAVFGSSLCLAETPTEVLKAFEKAALTKDFDATWEHAAKFEGQPEVLTQYFKEEVGDFIRITRKGWKFEILEEKIDGDCAVVVINDIGKGDKDTFDLDPIYLIKQNGKWKVLPELTNWDEAKRGMKDQVATLEKLDAWFEGRKKELRNAKDQ